MVNLEVFDLRLDRANSTYSAGDTLRGTIYLSSTAKQRVKIKELLITLIGEAKTSWTNKVSDNIYDTSEPYLNDRQLLTHQLKDSYDELGSLASGVHQAQFQFLLPRTLPSSYESEFGHVRYTLHGEVHLTSADPQRSVSFRRGFSSRNKTISVEKPILVMAQVDVAQLAPSGPNSSLGLRKEDGIETAGCCGVRVGYINASIRVPRSAYALGESIPVEVEIENCTRSRRLSTNPSRVSLVQDVHFRSISYFQTACDTKTITRLIQTSDVENPHAGETVDRRVEVKIPSNLPATSIGNTIITIAYKLRLDVGDCFEIILPIGVASKGS